MSPKVVFLFSPGPFGGAEKLVLAGAKTMKIPIFLIKELRSPRPCEDFIMRANEEGIETEVFNSQKRYDRELIKKIQTHIDSVGFTHVHSHGLKANFINSFLKVKTIATQHGQTSHDIKARILEIIENYRLYKIDRLICVSDSMLKSQNHPHKVLIENCLTEPLPFIKREYLSSSNFKVLFLGRLSKEKGVKNIPLLASNLSEIDFHVYGDGDYRDMLIKESEKMNNLHYHGFSSDTAKILEQHHLLLIPSFREGLPLVALEAACSGLPILASAVGGLPKLLKSESFLVKPNDLTELTKKIHTFKENYVEKVNQFESISNFVNVHYSMERWMQETKALYESF